MKGWEQGQQAVRSEWQAVRSEWQAMRSEWQAPQNMELIGLLLLLS